MTTGLKPFNLEEAKAGKPIVCRDGTPAKFIAHVPEEMPGCRVIIFSDGTLRFRNENGTSGNHLGAERGTGALFMAPEKKTGWINIYDHGEEVGYIYDSKEKADVGKSPNKHRIGCIEITYEEGQGL